MFSLVSQPKSECKPTTRIGKVASGVENSGTSMAGSEGWARIRRAAWTECFNPRHTRKLAALTFYFGFGGGERPSGRKKEEAPDSPDLGLGASSINY
ncbi:hypothetical protein Trydic_g13598 [Trypoxylus dichotomus]